MNKATKNMSDSIRKTRFIHKAAGLAPFSYLAAVSYGLRSNIQFHPFQNDDVSDEVSPCFSVSAQLDPVYLYSPPSQIPNYDPPFVELIRRPSTQLGSNKSRCSLFQNSQSGGSIGFLVDTPTPHGLFCLKNPKEQGRTLIFLFLFLRCGPHDRARFLLFMHNTSIERQKNNRSYTHTMSIEKQAQGLYY